MGQASNKIRQEAVAMIIEGHKQWLTQVIEGEKEAEQEATRYIAELRQKVGQIAAEFKDEARHRSQSP